MPPPSDVSEPKLSIVEVDNSDADLPRLARLNAAAFSASARAGAGSATFGAGGGGGGVAGAAGLLPVIFATVPPIL